MRSATAPPSSAARACVDKHDLHKQRRALDAVIGTNAYDRPPGLKHIAYALNEVSGVHGVHPIMSRDSAVKEVVGDELMAHAGAYIAPVDGLF